ncbi:MAG TPA: nuclear transport factor 2 family protein [Longimicrobiales bacterium]|nr:nuclear transport factor 2 family protein [Longimicrobiales bacterium]
MDVLQASAAAWNRGDLQGFLEPYENSPRTSFAGQSGFIRGYDALRESYARGYWSSGAPADSLAFEVIEVRPLGARAALMLGRYLLSDRTSGALTSTGIFSLVFVHTADGWKITHDHTSETP